MTKKIREMNFSSPAAKRNIKAIISHIEKSENGATIEQLCAKLGLLDRCMRNYIAHLRSNKIIYVYDWIWQESGPPHMLFKIGDHKDTPRPSGLFQYKDRYENDPLPVRQIVKKWVNGEWVAA